MLTQSVLQDRALELKHKYLQNVCTGMFLAKAFLSVTNPIFVTGGMVVAGIL